MRTLNLGILAHVDAGKTTLTERLLYSAGVIDTVGSVDSGTTQTDSLELERQRGITIRSAVVSFPLDDVVVNLIDTPGHPDFIAEVERVLSVLDGVVLVISAVEGVQPQTIVLMRALQRLRIPTLLFANKIDRAGAQYERTLQAIAQRLTPAIVTMGSVSDIGTRSSTFIPYTAANTVFVDRLTEVLTAQNDALLEAFVDDESLVLHGRLHEELARQVSEALAYPVFFGSAITGEGVGPLARGITRLLPAHEGDSDAEAFGIIFKIERGSRGEKVVYVRMFSGAVRTRDRLRLSGGKEGRVSAISVFENGSDIQSPSVSAGQIGILWGLADAEIGDSVGESPMHSSGQHFSPPTLEAVVRPSRAEDKGALHAALSQLAEQDPLINLRQDDVRQEIYVSLYGEVQKEVIQATLASEFGIEAQFSDTTPVCIERVISVGETVEVLNTESNPFSAAIGLRIEPASRDSGIEFRLGVGANTVPTYVYKNLDIFRDMMSQYVRQTLGEGLFGWQVTDCLVTMTHCGYPSSDGPPSRRGPRSTASDFRNLTPLVLMSALKQAGTVVCEPVHAFHLEMPADSLGNVLSALPDFRAVPHAQVIQGSTCAMDGEIPAVRMHEMEQEVRTRTAGEGVLDFAFDRYEPVRGEIPSRPRTDFNPLNPKEYLLHIQRKV